MLKLFKDFSLYLDVKRATPFSFSGTYTTKETT